MSSDVFQTFEVVRNNAHVVLNLGLCGPSGMRKHRLLPSQRVVLYAEALKGFMKPGFTAEVVAEFDVEPTMVVEGYFADDAMNSLLIWEMIVGAEQDCIAVLYPDLDDRKGYLIGPNREAWGEFDQAFFLFPSTQLEKPND